MCELPQGPYTANLATLHWGAPPAGAPTPIITATQEGDTVVSPAPQPCPLSPLRHGRALREVRLAGKPGPGEVRALAARLFEGLPSLQRVCAPAAGLACGRGDTV